MILSVICLAMVATALAAPRYVTVTGAGIGTDTDQNVADQNADSQAQTNLQSACSLGEITTRSKIFDQCSQISDRYVCNVNYTGICKFGN